MKKRTFITAVIALALTLSMLFAAGASAATYKLGDVTGDGKITSADARTVLRCAAKLERLSEARTKAADADRSGKVNSSDARTLLRVAAKLDTLEAGENDVFEEADVVVPLACVTDNVDPLGVYTLSGGRVAVYFTTPTYNEGDGLGPDENGAYGAPRITADEKDHSLLPEDGGDFTALLEDGKGPDEEEESGPVPTIGEGDFSALDEDGRDPAEIGEGDFSALDEDGRDPAEIGEDADPALPEQFIYIIDVEKDEVSEVYTLPKDQYLFCVRKNGQFVTMKWDEAAGDLIIFVFDENMKFAYSFRMPNEELYADPENDCFYVYADNGSSLERWDFNGVKETVFSLQHGMKIADYDPASGFAAVLEDSVVPGVSQDLMLYNIEKDEFIFEQPGYSFSYRFLDDLLIASCNIPQDGAENKYITALNTIPLSENGGERLLRMPDDSYLTCYYGTSVALTASAVFEAETETFLPTVYYLTDIKAGRITLPIGELGAASYLVSCYLPETDKIVAASYIYDENDADAGHPELYLIDPAAAQYADELKPVERPVQEVGTRPLTPGWEELRAKADAIEKDFDVTVYFGDQALDYQDGSGYVFVSLEDPAYVLDDATPTEQTGQMLDMLRKGLSEYPDGFFGHFKNSRGQGGLRIMLVRDLTNPDGDFLAGGVAFKYGAWYNVAIGADNIGDTDTIHHEIWHAAESRIEKDVGNAFYGDEWEALNPPGFEYSEDLDHYYEHQELFAYIIPWDYDASKYDGVWFAEIYSTVTGCEDRATLIETLTSEGFDFEGTGYARPDEWIAQMPHLQAKLDYLAGLSEKVFGCVYWETILDRMPKG